MEVVPGSDTTPLSVFRALLEGAQDGLLALDGDGAVVEANAAAAALVGARRSQLVGTPLASLLPPGDRSGFLAALRAVGASQESETRLDDAGLTLSLRVVSADEPRLIAATLRRPAAPAGLAESLLRMPQAMVAIDPAGRIVLANEPARTLVAPARLHVGSEIPKVGPGSRLREFAERLTVLRAPLAARSVELEDGRLLRVSGTPAHGDEPAILLLEDVTHESQAELRKQEFVRNAAHQLRTPLAAITSAVEVLESGAKDDPEMRDTFLAHIRTHADRLARLTRGLLVLARVDGGELAPLEPVELAPLLVALAEGAAPTEVTVDCPSSLAGLAEPDLLYEALTALLDNAVKHADGAPVSLSAREDGGSVTVSVIDAGGGVLPADRPRILEAFYRASPGGDGFGLGLAIAARAVEAMGGELSIDDPERGGRFTIHLRGTRVAA